MYSSSLKPFVINGTDIGFLLQQVSFRPLFDANHNAVINWDGTTPIYDGYGNLLYSPPVGEVAGSVTALAAVGLWGTSYQTVVDLTGIRDVSGANNNLAGVNYLWGTSDQLFPRMVAADYSNYAVAGDGKVNGGAVGSLTSNDYAVTLGGTSTAHDGTAITINNITDGSARTISRLTTTGGVTFDTWANHPGDPAFAQHAPNEIYYNAEGVATVLNWGDIGAATIANPNGLGQYDTQARFIGSAGASTTGSATAGADPTLGDQYIGGLNPGVSPSNGFFVLFGQFFDHGLDFIGKGEQGKTIKIQLAADDPLYGMIGPDGQPTTSITINRANVATVDASGTAQYADHTSPFIDQSQTYGSHEQLTQLLRAWIQDPVDGTWKPGMSMFDGHTMQTEWKNAAGVMVNDTLPTLNELRAHVAATGRDALTWEDVLDLRNRDASGHVTSGTSGSPLILDSNPRFDYNHLHGIHDYNNDSIITANEYSSNTGQRTAVDDAIAFLGTQVRGESAPGAGDADSFGMVGGMLTLTLGRPLAAGPSTIPAGTYTGASALMLWVNFSDFSIMAPPGMTIPNPSGNVHDAVSEILMASVGDHYIAGDGRVNENFGLTSIHHVFHEEHNFQVQNFIDALHRDAVATGDQTNLHSYQIDTGHGTNAAGDYVNASGEITWDLEKMFQSTKLIVEMEYQHAAVDQYARNVTPNIQEFVGYSPDKNPGVALEYAQSAFRFGHSTLRETIDTIDPAGGLTGKIMGYALRAAFLNPDQYAQTGAAATLLGMTHQQMNDVDEFVTPALNQGLLGQPLDLAAINIARGRDVGIPTLNDLRSALGLTQYTSWNDFGNNMQHPTSLANFIAAYSFNGDADALAKAQAIMGLADGTIAEGAPEAMGYTAAEAVAFLSNDASLSDPGATATDLDLAGRMGAFGQIDSWLGGLAEVHQPGGLLGETFDLIFVTQIESLMDGDRFYYLYRLAGQQFAEEVQNGQLKDIVERNTGLTHLNGNVFGYADKYYDFGANREVYDAAAGGNTETRTTSNNHKYGDVVNQNGIAVTTGTDANVLGAIGGIGALTRNNTTLNNASNNFQNAGAGVGIYTNSGRSSALDGSIIKIGGVAYVRDTRMEDTGQDTGAANLNGGTNLDGTPNSGADSNEVIVGTKWGDMVYAQGGDDTVYGEGGNDIIYGGYGIDRLYGGDGSDKIYGGDNPDLIDGGSGDDFLYGESSGTDINGNDQVIGGSGNDFISGGTGIDKLSGGSGDDHIKGDQDTDPFTHGSDGNDWVEGNSGGDILYGDNGDDLLEGGADQDQMFGGKGDDIIRPGDATGALTIGTDEVLGGDGVTDEGTLPGTKGFDLIDFSDNTVRPGGVNFDVGNQINPAVAVNGIPIQTPSFQIEGVVGSAAGDTLVGDSDNEVAGDAWVIGGNGDDTLQGGFGNDIIVGGSIRLDSLIGKYNSGYTHNNANAGLTEADQLQDALYQGASHRVLYSETIDDSGLIDMVNAQFGLTTQGNGSNLNVADPSLLAYQKHFTEMLRSDQFKDMVLGNRGSETATGSGGGNDTLVLSGNLAEYSFQAIHANADGTGAVIGLRITDHGYVDPVDPQFNRQGEGSDIVLGVTNFKFADGTFTQAQLAPPQVSVNDVALTEGDSGTANASFTISLDHAFAQDVVVTYGTSDGSAVAPGDYTGTSGTVTIPAGSTSVTVSVPVLGDTTFEADETFNVNLTAASNGATIADSLGVGTITNDDAMPSLAITGASVTEGNSGTQIMTFTVTQSAVSGVATTVNWSTADGTATAGSDYVGASGTLTIPAGSTTGQIQIAINGDTVLEANETFTVSLTSPTNAAIGTGTATGTIIDNDLNVLFNANFPSNLALPGTGNMGSLGAIPAGGTTYAISNVVSPTGGFALTGINGNIITRTGTGLAADSTYSLDITATQGSSSNTETITVRTGTTGDDTITTGPGDTTVYAWTGNDTVTGGAGDDNLFGQDGNDILVGGAGNDWMQGGSGTDTLVLGGGRTNYSFTLNAANNLVTTDTVGTDGTDTFGSGEVLRFGGIAGTDNAAFNAGGPGSQVVIGSSGNDFRNGGAGDDIIVTGAGDDTITYNVNNGGTANGGHDMVIGGAGTDTFILNGNSSAEDFYIYSRDAFLAANPLAVLGADTAIVITRNGTGAANIIDELSGIEEIKINTTTSPQTGTLANGNNYTGAVSGDQIHVIGDFTGTGLAYNTITINGSSATDMVDITGLTSDHRIVFNTNGGGDTVLGNLRPQDVVYALGGVENAGSIAQTLIQPDALSIPGLGQGLGQGLGWAGGLANFGLGQGQSFLGQDTGPTFDTSFSFHREFRLGEHSHLDVFESVLDRGHHFWS